MSARCSINPAPRRGLRRTGQSWCRTHRELSDGTVDPRALFKGALSYAAERASMCRASCGQCGRLKQGRPGRTDRPHVLVDLLYAAIAEGRPLPDPATDLTGEDYMAAFHRSGQSARTAFSRPGVKVTGQPTDLAADLARKHCSWCMRGSAAPARHPKPGSRRSSRRRPAPAPRIVSLPTWVARCSRLVIVDLTCPVRPAGERRRPGSCGPEPRNTLTCRDDVRSAEAGGRGRRSPKMSGAIMFSGFALAQVRFTFGVRDAPPRRRSGGGKAAGQGCCGGLGPQVLVQGRHAKHGKRP
jgi:hypothetical protein